jgi:large subunit ribosomal protein L31
MKQGLHPDNYRLVVFEDTSNGFRFLTRSTVASEETTKWEDGNEYPLVTVHISSASHPFYTGQEKLVDIEGRVDRFKARQEAAKKHAEKNKKAAAKKADKQEAATEPEVQKLGAKPTSKQ